MTVEQLRTVRHAQPFRPFTHPLIRNFIWMSTLLFAALISPLRADTIRTTDDRAFEGNIVEQSPQAITIDTLIAGIRAKLTLKTAEIARVHAAPLAADFFDPPPPPPEADDAVMNPGDTAYLEIPVTGAVGKTIFADGIASALAYAAARKIEHVVFVIDSVGGGDFGESLAIHHALRRRPPGITCHALVRNCDGDAIVIAAACATLHLSPGARLGGPSNPDVVADAKVNPQSTLLRYQVATEIASRPGLTPDIARVLRSLVDPGTTFAAWKDAAVPTGINIGANLPPKLKPEEVLFDDRDHNDTIHLDVAHAAAMGFATFDGGPQQLGSALGIEHWKAESEFGRRAMSRAAAARVHRASTALARNQFERRVRDNIRQREAVDRYLQRFLQRASEIDPANPDYGAYARRYAWKAPPGKIAVPTDAAALTTGYLNRVATALKILNQLGLEAANLGIAPTYKPADLDADLADVEAKLAKLK